LANSGTTKITADEINFNSDNMKIVGTSAGGSIFLAGDLRSTSLDLGFSDQILNRAQNNSIYMPIGANLNSLSPPTSSVSFGNQLLSNL
jgi:hypothetical protein